MNNRTQISIFDELIVDNFAGGGGASTGIELATCRPVDIAINHDPDAILMHKANHPHTEHYCESVWDVDIRKICRRRSVGLMWLSPDCKHFSRAKGGRPCSKSVRGLAWIAVKWAGTVRPRVIILENVPEFQTWCPLTADGHPDFKHKGKTFLSFVNALRFLGYEVQYTTLKACDFGAPTIRERFFMIARCDGKPIVFPKPTHGAGAGLLPYRTAAECIDFSQPCPSIFTRSKPLAENTLRRIARGLDKFTLKADKPFIMSNNTGNACHAADEPLPTVTTGNRNYLCSPSIQKYYSNVIGSDVNDPLSTVTAVDHNAIMAASIIQYHTEQAGAEVRGQAVDKPLYTLDCSPRYALTSAHIVSYYGGDHFSSVNDPLATITTRERHGLIESHLCILRNNQDCKALNEPLPTECASEHFAEIRTRIVKYAPGVNLEHWEKVRELLNRFCGYNLADDEILIRDYGGVWGFVGDIGMRMLSPRELYNAQGFPPDYIIETDCNGNTYPRSKQIARCGNSVPPPFAEALVRANCPEMCGNKITTMRDLSEQIAM